MERGILEKRHPLWPTARLSAAIRHLVENFFKIIQRSVRMPKSRSLASWSSIKTFDFSVIYTTIPLTKLKEKEELSTLLADLILFSFEAVLTKSLLQ